MFGNLIDFIGISFFNLKFNFAVGLVNEAPPFPGTNTPGNTNGFDSTSNIYLEFPLISSPHSSYNLKKENYNIYNIINYK